MRSGRQTWGNTRGSRNTPLATLWVQGLQSWQRCSEGPVNGDGPPPLPTVRPLDGAREDSVWPAGVAGRDWARAHVCLARTCCSNWRPGSCHESRDGALVKPTAQDTCPPAPLPSQRAAPDSVSCLPFAKGVPPARPPSPGQAGLPAGPWPPSLLLRGPSWPRHSSPQTCSESPCASECDEAARPIAPRAPATNPLCPAPRPSPGSCQISSQLGSPGQPPPREVTCLPPSLPSAGSQLRRPLLTGPSSAQLLSDPTAQIRF